MILFRNSSRWPAAERLCDQSTSSELSEISFSYRSSTICSTKLVVAFGRHQTNCSKSFQRVSGKFHQFFNRPWISVKSIGILMYMYQELEESNFPITSRISKESKRQICPWGFHFSASSCEADEFSPSKSWCQHRPTRQPPTSGASTPTPCGTPRTARSRLHRRPLG